MLEYYFNIDEDIYRLPVNPPKIKVKSGANVESIDMTTTGKITLFSGKDVDSISFNSFWPSEYMPYCNHQNIRSIEDFKKAMVNAKNKGTQVRFIVTEIDINKLFYIQTFDPEWEEGAGASRLNFEIQLIECSNPEIPVHIDPKKNNNKSKGSNNKGKKATNTKDTKKRDSKHDKKGKTVTYIVKRGDCPWKIAKKFYGNGAKYKKIIDANKKITVNGTKLIAGMKLVIPDAK